MQVGEGQDGLTEFGGTQHQVGDGSRGVQEGEGGLDMKMGKGSVGQSSHLKISQ